MGRVALRTALVGATLSFCSQTRACLYHFLHGLPEPTGNWPANLSTAVTQISAEDSADDAAITNMVSAPAMSAGVASNAISNGSSSPSIDAYVTGWLVNTTGAEGRSTNGTINNDVASISADVQEVAYTSTDVYIKATGIPDYYIGPFNGDPNTPVDDNATFDIPRDPQPATGTHTATGLGAIGVLINGVDVFNMSDNNSYQNDNVWFNNAGYVEASSFDAAKGHPQQQGVYHNHENPVSLEAEVGATSSNPTVIGYAIDGYPILNDYASLTPNGPIEKMMSGYELRTYSNNTRGNGGPPVNSTYPDGYFEQDYQYVAGQSLASGEAELDQYNGAFVYTPQFPNGTYAYFATTDTSGNAAYPYMLGPDYYGTPATDDLANSTVNVPSTAVVYTAVASLFWNNSTGNGDGVTWSTSAKNWVDESTGVAYSNGSNVAFNDSNNSHYSVTLSTTVSPGSILVSSTGNYSISGAGAIAGTGSLSKSGSGTLTLSTLNTFTGGVSVSAGLLEIAPTSVASATTSALPDGPLTISGSGQVQLESGVTQGSQSASTPITAPTSNVNITSLGITGNGTLDITNNHIIINYGSGADPISSIVALITSGYNGGTWTGIGITSSTALVNFASYGIGYADAADAGNPAGLSSGQIEIAYTLLGDANLDGKVNGTDFTLMATHFNDAVTNGWDAGDFNYSGTVNGNDFVLLADNFNLYASTSATSADDLSALNDFAQSNGISLTSVPEPGTVMLAIAVLILPLSRRRRRRGACIPALAAT